MKIYIADPKFRPVTLELVTQDELDQLIAIAFAVANNKVHHLPQLSKAAAGYEVWSAV